MATRARKVPELPATTTVSGSDWFIIEKVGANNSSVTSKISGTNVRKQMVKGPYTNDGTAATAGVAVGELYYTPTGDVKVRLS